jgi:hypothetical protein
MGAIIEQSFENSTLAICRKHSKPLGRFCTREIPHVMQRPRMILGSQLVGSFSN